MSQSLDVKLRSAGVHDTDVLGFDPQGGDKRIPHTSVYEDLHAHHNKRRLFFYKRRQQFSSVVYIIVSTCCLTTGRTKRTTSLNRDSISGYSC